MKKNRAKLLAPLVIVFALVTRPVATIRAARRAWKDARR